MFYHYSNNDLDNWKVESLENGKAMFYKGKNYIL